MLMTTSHGSGPRPQSEVAASCKHVDALSTSIWHVVFGRWLAEFVGLLMDSYQQVSAEKESLLAAMDVAQQERQQLIAEVAAQRAEIDALRALIGQLQAGGAG